MKLLKPHLLVSSAAVAFASGLGATTFLSDSFVTVPAGSQDKTQGEYRENNGLNAAANADVAGGSIIGFTAGNPWGGNSGLPRTVTTGLNSTSIPSSGGSVEFRGSDDNLDRYVYRQFSNAGGGVTYFSGTLQASMLDDDAISLIGFLPAAEGPRSVDLLNNTGNIGVAFGFKGDGNGGMDLIARYRDESITNVDSVLQAGISAGQSYTVVGRIEWNIPASLGGSRDQLDIWVDPQSPTFGGFPPAALSTLGFIGEPTSTIASVLAQRNFGTGLTDAVFMDEVRVTSAFSDLAVIPEPSQAGLLVAFMGLACSVLIRRRIR